MYDAQKRDRYRVLVTAVTGVAAVASATAIGVLTGAAAKATVDDDAVAAQLAQEPKRTRSVVRWKERPRRTIFETEYVQTVAPGSTDVGGGTVAPTTSGGSSGSGSGGGGSSSGDSGGGSSGPSTPAPPPPPPAPSSGS
jgi:uncharacterized membrane protein YgcG